MKLTIEKVDNGFIISGDARREVYSNGYDDSEDLIAIQSMLYSVLEYFGYFGSKHDTERLKVVIEKQDADT